MLDEHSLFMLSSLLL